MGENGKTLGESREESLDRYRAGMSIAACLYALIGYSEDCERPIRLWFKILLALMGFHTISLIATEVLAKRQSYDSESVEKCSMGLNALVHSFLFLWTMVGVVWLLDDYEECLDGKLYTDYFMGFIIASAILLAYYGIFLLFTLCLCCIVTVSCYGSWRLGKFTRDYEEII